MHIHRVEYGQANFDYHFLVYLHSVKAELSLSEQQKRRSRVEYLNEELRRHAEEERAQRSSLHFHQRAGP